MRNPLLLLSVVVFLISSCSPTYVEIGKVNMISTRNIDTKLEYKLLASYAGASKQELRKSKAKIIEDAIDETVRKVAGGEYLMNARILLVGKKGKQQYFAVEGDVWGIAKEISYRGFKIGDKITWKKFGKYHKGTFKAFKDNNSCIVENDEQNKTIELDYEDITKIEK